MKILKRRALADSSATRITSIEVLSPDIARKARPGQFIALMVSDKGERIPLTIVDTNKDTGSITLIFQELGFTTQLLGQMKEGDSLYSLVGPLGHATDIRNYGQVILVGGGVGIAEIYPVARALKASGNHITTILGARTKSLLILEDELKAISDNLLVATDDGSYGRKAFTTDILDDELQKQKYGLVYSVGPIPMMKRSAAVTAKYGVKTIVSLNAIMVDATGMCGCCRVTIGGKTLFSCVDGPEFDAQQVDWDELVKRNRIYEDKEKHICNLKAL
ncbi:MAG: sulfide/dihydroorotate dehydrogenase-like FAD/NAD-binding protein [Candidatus Omnitrophica bacterium]|nr:sulfide/dihydroorotate dehydrogenase-like FAD/NAD-binding protein [Candidatus Omnitrophota bacterium]MBU0881225.1 sulfide/dihydroorotate dehydrogenase-like FAD/NAD-binding protein [Candidatus Omnitrophota bacterium]MBU0894962.1 sulfide/dihydroorotate dehydrogenase-like FAD/NAD-binding protein [Candidatus Omnitrophota bacterium]MBU1808201.1 sulfide/dihydroorotate dehydrogenase-like FAD/NAD-binding protein [Candidatus Omnitrophota bacterium]